MKLLLLNYAHGDSEEYHGELKTDMDMERLPPGKSETNELVQALTIIAYNLLRMKGAPPKQHLSNFSNHSQQ